MSRYTDTHELTLICTDEKKLFTDKRQCNAWIKMHEKKCKECANATMTNTEFTIKNKINSGNDNIKKNQIYTEMTQRISDIVL
jgi:hypothetical protein